MKKETYATPEIEAISISPVDALTASIGDIEVDMGENGSGFF